MSIKVAVRVRSFSKRELDVNPNLCIAFDGQVATIINPKDQSQRQFAFDHLFWSHDKFKVDESGYHSALSGKYCDQKRVYDNIGKEILQNSLEGFNCCLFSYGQSGAGIKCA